MSDDWDDIADWWVDAVREDPTQSVETLTLLRELLEGADHVDGLTIDIGCGEGQAMRELDGSVVGTDLSAALLRHAAAAGPVVQARMPDLSWVRPGAFSRAISIGLLDLIEDHGAFFASTADVVSPGGQLIVVVNHAVATAPQSEPLVDPDGEVLWRWGAYLQVGKSSHPTAGRPVELIHRPLGVLLTAAAKNGWSLEELIEKGPSRQTLDRFPEYRGQAQIPTIAGIRWSRR